MLPRMEILNMHLVEPPKNRRPRQVIEKLASTVVPPIDPGQYPARAKVGIGGTVGSTHPTGHTRFFSPGHCPPQGIGARGDAIGPPLVFLKLVQLDGRSPQCPRRYRQFEARYPKDRFAIRKPTLRDAPKNGRSWPK